MFGYRKSPITKKVNRHEWDFSVILREEEQRASCFYEYGRESAYIVTRLDESRAFNEADAQERALRNNPLLCALPCRRVGDKYFDGPWLAKPPKWRASFCRNLAEHWEGLSYARLLQATGDYAFHVGISAHFPWQRWTERHTRLLDRRTGLELLLVTIDWGNFDDTKLIRQFSKWIKSPQGRPKVGLRDTKGKRRDAWRKKLERLAVLRLRHYYTLEEISGLLPEVWMDKDKFSDEREVRRERKAAQQTLLELFPFLPKNTKPRSWSAA